MRLNLEDLRLRGGDKHVCTYSVDIAPVTSGGVDYEVVVPDGVTVDVERVAGGYLVRLELTAKVFGPCSRCLAEASLQIRAEEEEFVPTAAGGWVESQASQFIDDMVIDLSALSREALVLALPECVVCAKDCKGLCAQCGADLNQVDCGCAPLET